MNYVIYTDGIGKITKKSFQIRLENDLIWLPKSQTRAQFLQDGEFKQYRVIVPYWLASEKGFFAKSYNGTKLYKIQETEEKI